MRVSTSTAAAPPSPAADAEGPQPNLPGSVSLVIWAGEGTRDIEGLLARATPLLATLVEEHELIVVADGLAPDVGAQLQALRIDPAQAERRVFLSTRRLDRYAAAWHGIENARGARVAIVDATSDEISFLPELLRRAAGADIVFAQGTDRTPPPLRRAIARRLVETVQRSLGVTSVRDAAPFYRVLNRQVVSFIAQHSDPVAAYRRLPAGGSFTQAHLQYSARGATPPVAPIERLARETRQRVSTTLDVVTSWRGHDTTFFDPACSDETTCLPKLAVLRRGVFEIAERHRIRNTGSYHPANPTLARLDRRTWVNVRLVNYRKRGHGSTVSGDGVYRSRNLVFEWDPASQLSGPAREAAATPAAWAQDTRIRGLEDQRWTVHQGRLWLSACCCQVPHEEGGAKMVLGRLNEALDGVDLLVPLRYDAAREAEKNWLLWSLGGKLLAIYGYHPLTLLVLDPDTGRARPYRVHRTPHPARRFRGSAGPLPVAERPGHWLVLVHEVARRFEQPVYAHRWLLIHPEQGMVAYSRPFVFDHVGIEYAAGLLDNGDGTLSVTYGFEDREARWAVIDTASVLASLYPVAQEPLMPRERSSVEHALEAAVENATR